MKPDIDWANLGFRYMPTDCHVQFTWREGQWSDLEIVDEPHVKIHIAATALHYGQSAFEGLKAFSCKDGKIRLFRPEMNAVRMVASARRVCMAEVPETMFLDAVRAAVNANTDYIPPYGTGGSLYVRPLLFGSGPTIGIRPSNEYTFLVLVVPVGPYYQGGFEPVRAIVFDDYDRAAPHGVGNVKVAGNYAPGLEPHFKAVEQGFTVELYLDAKEHNYIDEFATSNFVGIKKDGTYVTPKSHSILPSVTNVSLQQIAHDLGIPVEVRPIAFSELPEFAEIGACGTAVVLTPVNEIVRNGTILRVGPAKGFGPVMQKLYSHVTAIQYGEAPDIHGWTVEV